MTVGRGKTDDHFDPIYLQRASDYHELVIREDAEGNLGSALAEAADFSGTTVVELGAGTGRVTRLLAAMAGKVLAFDRSRPMLDVAAGYLGDAVRRNVTLATADNRSVPLADNAADIVVEGWSFGHTVCLADEEWKDAATQIVEESMRLLKPGGTLILIETLGTGFRSPRAPGPILPQFFSWLETERGFAHKWIRTDYTFETLGKTRELVPFFFGQMVDHEVLPSGQVRVPECTGLWWKRKQP
jgi:ubiquinone/menaquinone biosynthesis C-methylase UbiE